MKKTKEDILQSKSAKEVFLWMQSHPTQTDREVAAYFHYLSKKQYKNNYPNSDFLPTIPKK